MYRSNIIFLLMISCTVTRSIKNYRLKERKSNIIYYRNALEGRMQYFLNSTYYIHIIMYNMNINRYIVHLYNEFSAVTADWCDT